MISPMLEERSWLRQVWLVISRVLLVGLTGLAIWLPGLVWYVSVMMPDQVEEPTAQTDVIVVLTGGSERLRVGLSLLKDGKAPLLFVSGVNPETTLEALLAEEAPLPAGLRNRILLGHVASDTVGNAIETAVWMRAHHMTSIRLVTASYHMPRSLLEFQAALPLATVIAHPVFPSSVKQNAWWSYPGTAVLFISEYNKYLVARLRLMLPDGPQEAIHNSQAPKVTLPPGAAPLASPKAPPVETPSSPALPPLPAKGPSES